MAKGKNKQQPTTDDQSNESLVLTPEDQAIARRVASESAEWGKITEESMLDYSMSVHPLDLERNFPEAYREQRERRYAFRFCERVDKRIDELTRGGHPITRWKICTRTTTPFLDKYIDPVLGCIARLDQIMLFRPWERHMIEQNAKNDLARARAESGKPENVAMRNAGEGIEAQSGPEVKINSGDEVVHEDISSVEGETQDLGDLVVDS